MFIFPKNQVFRDEPLILCFILVIFHIIAKAVYCAFEAPIFALISLAFASQDASIQHHQCQPIIFPSKVIRSSYIQIKIVFDHSYLGSGPTFFKSDSFHLA